MKLPAFFGHKRSINLLPRDQFESSTLGVVLEWSLVFGKWAVILTQLVVMSVFLYRFSLDRKLTDLRKEIASNVAIVKSYEQVERDYILTQAQLKQVKVASQGQKLATDALTRLSAITPSDVWYDRITLSPTNISLTAYAASLPAFGQFLTSVESEDIFDGVRVGKIESSASRGAQMQFDVILSFAGVNQEKGSKK